MFKLLRNETDKMRNNESKDNEVVFRLMMNYSKLLNDLKNTVTSTSFTLKLDLFKLETNGLKLKRILNELKVFSLQKTTIEPNLKISFVHHNQSLILGAVWSLIVILIK